VLLTAEATVYGRRMIDSLWYTVGWPVKDVVQVGAVESYLCDPPTGANTLQHGAELSINQGGAVLWINSRWGSADDSLDVQFDEPAVAAGFSSETTVGVDQWGDQITVLPNDSGDIQPFGTIVPIPDGCGVNIDYWIDGPDNVRVRTFPHVGTYHWHSVRQGVAGTIHVIANADVQ
jgi:hypothetical protein